MSRKRPPRSKRGGSGRTEESHLRARSGSPGPLFGLVGQAHAGKSTSTTERRVGSARTTAQAAPVSQGPTPERLQGRALAELTHRKPDDADRRFRKGFSNGLLK